MAKMIDIEMKNDMSLIKTDDLNFDRLKELSNTISGMYVRYDKEVDSLIILMVDPTEPTIVHYVDSHFGLLFTEENKFVVGFQIEAFAKDFIKSHQNVEKNWKVSFNIEKSDKNIGQLTFMIQDNRDQIANLVKESSKILARKLNYPQIGLLGKQLEHNPIYMY